MKCIKCESSEAVTYVEWFPVGAPTTKKFRVCWKCSDELFSMGTDERDAEFRRLLGKVVWKC